jgi:ribonuclease P protein component
VYDQGTRINSPSFAMFYLRRDAGGSPRTGFTTPRALGKANVRNRIRRRMREAVRLELERMLSPLDMIFHPRPAVLGVDFPALRREVVKAFEKCRTL